MPTPTPTPRPRPRPRAGALLLPLTLSSAACGLSVVGEAPELGDAQAEDARDASQRDAKATDAALIDVAASADADADADADVTADASVDAPADAPTDVDAAPSLFGEECPAGKVYDDDFSTDPAGRWHVIAGTWEWSAAQHTYTLKQVPADGTRDVALTWIGPRPKWKDYDVDVEETVSLPPNDHGDVGPIFRVTDLPKSDPQPTDSGSMFLAAAQVNTSSNLILARFQGGGFTQLKSNNSGYDTTKALTVHAKVGGTSMKAWLNDDTGNAIEATDATWTSGSIGLRSFKSVVVVRRVRVTCR